MSGKSGLHVGWLRIQKRRRRRTVGLGVLDVVVVGVEVLVR